MKAGKKAQSWCTGEECGWSSRDLQHAHSNAGVSRSVSIALAYVMHKERVPLDIALRRLRDTRPVAQPNQSFLQQLKEMEAKLGI